MINNKSLILFAATAEIKLLLIFIKNYINIFSKKIDIFVSNIDYNYTIDLEFNKKLLYKFIYNLFEKKFQIFRKYIEIVLEKQ